MESESGVYLEATGLFGHRTDELLRLAENAQGEWAFVIEDLSGRGTFRYNDDASFAAASVIKIPIMMTAFREARLGNVRLDDSITLRKEDKVGGSGVLKELHTGLTITLLDAIHLMIVVSDNTATNLVIDHIGQDAVNTFMFQKGCKGCRLENRLMRPRPHGPRNAISAAGIALLLRGLADRTIENPGDCDAMLEILKRQQYNEKIPRLLPREAVCAHKTGEVRGVTHDAGIVYGPGFSFVIVCLSQGLQDTRAGIDVISRVSRWTWDVLSAEL